MRVPPSPFIQTTYRPLVCRYQLFKSRGSNPVWVRAPPPAPYKLILQAVLWHPSAACYLWARTPLSAEQVKDEAAGYCVRQLEPFRLYIYTSKWHNSSRISTAPPQAAAVSEVTGVRASERDVSARRPSLTSGTN